jgi:hypothetical protein
MRMNYQIAEQYAKLIFDSHVKGKSFKPLLVEVFSKYNSNFLLTEADLKDSVKQVHAELIAKFRGLATKDKKAENYVNIITGLGRAILKFYEKNIRVDPTGYKIDRNFDFELETSSEAKAASKKSTVVNPAPTNTNVPVNSHYNPQLSFRNFLQESEIHEILKRKIIKIAANNQIITQSVIKEGLSDVWSGVKSMFGGKKTPKLHSYDEKIELLYGDSNSIREKLTNIVGLFAEKISQDRNSYSPADQRLADQLTKSLDDFFTKVNSGGLDFVKSVTPESSIVHKDVEAAKKQGLLGYFRTDRYQKALEKDSNLIFDQFMHLMKINMNSLLGKTSEEVASTLEKAVNSLTEDDQQTYIKFMEEYEPYYKKRYPELLETLAKEQKAAAKSGAPKPYANYKFGTITAIRAGLAALLFSLAGGLAINSEKLDDTMGQTMKATTTMVGDNMGGTGPAPDTGSGPNFGQNLKTSINNLQQHIQDNTVGNDPQVMELLGLLSAIQQASNENPEGFDTFLNQNPDLSNFLAQLHDKTAGGDLEQPGDVEDMLKTFADLNPKGIIKQLKGIGYENQQDSQSSGSAPAQTFNKFVQKKATSGPTKIVKDRIHGGTAEVKKVGPLQSAGRAMFGTKNVQGEKVKPGLVGGLKNLIQKPFQRGR